MATPENTFISGVHRHLPAELYRMKNHNQYNGGIADVWYSGNAADLWIEYKFIVVPKRDDTVITPNLSALQQEWLSRRHAEGRNVGVIIGSKLGGVWLPGVSWQQNLTSKIYCSKVVTRAELAATIERATEE